MKKKFVPRKPVSEASASKSLRPTSIIIRNDWMFNVIEGEKFWRQKGNGEIETLVSFSRMDIKGSGNEKEWREHVISIGSDGRRIETVSTHSNYHGNVVSIILEPEIVVNLKGSSQPLSAARWSAYRRSQPVKEFDTLLAVADIYGVTKLIDMDEGILEIVEML